MNRLLAGFWASTFGPQSICSFSWGNRLHLYSFTLQWRPGLRRLPQAHKLLTWLPLCVCPNKLALSHVQAQPRFSGIRWCVPLCGSCSSRHQSMETAFTAELFLPWYLPKKRRKPGAREHLFWFLLFLLFILKWNDFVQPPADTKFSFSPAPLPSLLLQSRRC